MSKVLNMLHLKFPIIQVGMAGITTAELVSKVANQGGLGTIGAGNIEDKIIKNGNTYPTISNLKCK